MDWEYKPWDGKKPWEEQEKDQQQCIHKSCPECNGTGKKNNGELCVHFIYCSCPKCTPQFKSI